MKTIFITGGAGFIGSHLVAECLRHHNRVIVYDNLSRGKLSYLPSSQDLTFIKGNILNQAKLAQAVSDSNPESIYHLAATHYIPECEANPQKAIRTNVEGTQNLLSVASQLPKVKIILASTGGIYADKTGSLQETDPTTARDIYTTTKITAENLAKIHAEKHNQPVTVARLFNVIGPHETNPHVIPEIIKQLKQGNRQLTLGNIKPRRDYVYVGDVASALYQLNQVKSSLLYNIFNIGSGHEYSVTEVIKCFETIINHKITVTSSNAKTRKNDRLSQLACIDKITHQTSWIPKSFLNQSLLAAYTYEQKD